MNNNELLPKGVALATPKPSEVTRYEQAVPLKVHPYYLETPKPPLPEGAHEGDFPVVTSLEELAKPQPPQESVLEPSDLAIRIMEVRKGQIAAEEAEARAQIEAAEETPSPPPLRERVDETRKKVAESLTKAKDATAQYLRRPERTAAPTDVTTVAAEEEAAEVTNQPPSPSFRARAGGVVGRAGERVKAVKENVAQSIAARRPAREVPETPESQLYGDQAAMFLQRLRQAQAAAKPEPPLPEVPNWTDWSLPRKEAEQSQPEAKTSRLFSEPVVLASRTEALDWIRKNTNLDQELLKLARLTGEDLETYQDNVIAMADKESGTKLITLVQKNGSHMRTFYINQTKSPSGEKAVTDGPYLNFEWRHIYADVQFLTNPEAAQRLMQECFNFIPELTNEVRLQFFRKFERETTDAEGKKYLVKVDSTGRLITEPIIEPEKAST